MKKLKRETIMTEYVWLWRCCNPECGHDNEECDDPDYMDSYKCAKCGEEYELED